MVFCIGSLLHSFWHDCLWDDGWRLYPLTCNSFDGHGLPDLRSNGCSSNIYSRSTCMQVVLAYICMSFHLIAFISFRHCVCCSLMKAVETMQYSDSIPTSAQQPQPVNLGEDGESYSSIPIFERSNSFHLTDQVKDEQSKPGLKERFHHQPKPSPANTDTTYQLSTSSSARTSIAAFENSFAPVDYPPKEEGAEVLQSHDFRTILLLFQYWPYSDTSLFCSTLSHRGDTVLDTLLTLARRGSGAAVAELRLSTEEKLKWLQPLLPSPEYQLRWTPFQTNYQRAADVAAIIDEETCRLFREIPFQHILRHTLGHSSSVEEFLYLQIFILPSRIVSYLQMCPDQVQKFSQVMEVRSRQHSSKSSPPATNMQ